MKNSYIILLLSLWVLSVSRISAKEYYIDPVKGNDRNTGTQRSRPWKTFAPAGGLMLSAGDRLHIVAPGRFDHSLMLRASGTAEKPVVVDFAPGRYDFYDTHVYKTRLHITNTNDVPDGLKSVALYIHQSKHVIIKAENARLVMHGKMIETYIDHSADITLQGISYDYHTPTVSEFKVASLQANQAELLVNRHSGYSIADSAVTWKGEGWQHKNSWYWQEFNPADGYLTRTGLSMDKVRFAEAGQTADGTRKVRAYFPSNPGFKQGYIYQTRDVTRDCAGIFMQRSKDILLKSIRIYFMHGMGIVSQYCENITMDGVVVKPDEKKGTTCAAWADILHFAGCRGQIEICNSYLSAANDDAVNVHGVHLRIMGQPAPNQLKLRFMHDQTYGFNPYAPGDSIALIRGSSLLAFGENVVTTSEMLNDREVLLTLKSAVTENLKADDAVENVTWTPGLRIHHTTITSIPTRGILATTRRRVVIADNSFLRTTSQAVLVEDDAQGWYESGLVKDMTIRNNQFIRCGGPVIYIHPENKQYEGPVHENIRITGNHFVLDGGKALVARSSQGITFSNNSLREADGSRPEAFSEYENCTAVKEENNR